jgi:hypothetical protein
MSGAWTFPVGLSKFTRRNSPQRFPFSTQGSVSAALKPVGARYHKTDFNILEHEMVRAPELHPSFGFVMSSSS